MSNSNPDLWASDNDLVLALKSCLDEPPKNWWWANLIPPFMYPFIIKRLKKNSKIVSCNLKTLSYIIDEKSIKKIDLLKVDCEGSELNVVEGISDNDWSLIKQLIIEVHDINGRLSYMTDLLKQKGFELNIIKEESLKETNLFNIVGTRKV